MFTGFLTADKVAPTNWVSHGGSLILVSTICVALIFAVLFPGAGRRSQTLAVALLFYAVVTFVIPVWYFGLDLSLSAYRYSVVPVMMLASAIAVLVAPVGPGKERTIATVGRPVFVGFVVVSVLVGFSVTNLRSRGPNWSTSLSQTYRAKMSRS